MPTKSRKQHIPRVSVITSTYREVADGVQENGRDSMLARAIDSVRGQTFADWDLWIAADCPPEADVRKIERLLASYGDDRLHLVVAEQRSKPVASGAAPKQLGGVHARGEYLAYLDADNQYTREHLAVAMAAFDCAPELDLVYCDTDVRLAGHHPNDFLKAVWPLYPVVGPLLGEPFIWRKPEWDERSRRRQERFNFIDSSEIVMSRTAYDAAGGMRELPNNDWELSNAMMRAGHASFRHLQHVGLIYWTSSLDHHRRHYIASRVSALDIPSALPIDLNGMEQMLNFDLERYYADRHHNAPQ